MYAANRLDIHSEISSAAMASITAIAQSRNAPPSPLGTCVSE
jgi:hypothetical protein